MIKKYVSDFVKRMKAIDAMNKPIVFWDSIKLGTYVKAKNGKQVNRYTGKRAFGKSYGTMMSITHKVKRASR